MITRERLVYERAMAEYPGKVLSKGYLRALKQINNTDNTYTLDFKAASADLNVEKKLDRNDTFIAHSITYGVAPVVSSEYGRTRPQTYPNFTAFPEVTTASSEFDPNDLELFWNAYITIKVGSVVQIENLATREALYVPQTQQSSASNRSQIDGAEDGIIHLEPNVILNGYDNLAVQLTVPLFSGAKVANTNSNTVNFIWMQLNGYLIKETGNK